MLDDETVSDLRVSLRDKKGFLVSGKYGRRLIVTDVTELVGYPALLLAYESRGSIIYPIGAEISPYRLTAFGFPLEAATWVSSALRALFSLKEPAAKALTHSPEGT